MHTIKPVIPYAEKVAEKLYRGLIKDKHRSHDPADIFSDGYDVAQTAICFLCNFLKKRPRIYVKQIRKGNYHKTRLLCRSVPVSCKTAREYLSHREYL